MKRAVRNVAASVRQRLLNESRRRGESFDYLASLYARERFLARLANSPHRHEPGRASIEITQLKSKSDPKPSVRYAPRRIGVYGAVSEVGHFFFAGRRVSVVVVFG